MFGLTCFCCGADITAPQFYKGKAYGYTCILKVNPEAKQTRLGKAAFVKGEVVKIVGEEEGRKEVSVKVGNKILVEIVYGDAWRAVTQDGVIMVIGYDGKPRFKSITRHQGKLYVNGIEIAT